MSNNNASPSFYNDLDPETRAEFERQDAVKAGALAYLEGQENKPRRTHKTRTLEIWALMGIHAQDTKHGGAWRLYVLASSLDHNEGCNHVLGICKGGSGKIERARLQAEVLALGVKRSTFFTWLADARAAHILNGTGVYLYLASQTKLAGIFLLNDIDEHKTSVPAKLLFKPGWKAIVWAAFCKSNHSTAIGYDEKLQRKYRGNIVSRRKLDDITGINPRKQRRLNQYVNSKRNIVITNIPGNKETAETLNNAARDHGQHRHYFTFNDPHEAGTNVFGGAVAPKYKRRIAHTLPSRHSVSDRYAKIGARGHRRQILAAITKGSRLVKVCNHPIFSATPRQVEAQTETFVKYPRIYFDAPPAKPRQAQPEPDPDAGERFIFRRKSVLTDVFDVLGAK